MDQSESGLTSCKHHFTQAKNQKMPTYREPVTLDYLEKYAATHLDKNAFDYFSTGAGEEVTRHENREAFKR